MKNEGKVLQFVPKNRRFFRRTQPYFNYYAPLFYVSLSVNFLLLALLICKNL